MPERHEVAAWSAAALAALALALSLAGAGTGPFGLAPGRNPAWVLAILATVLGAAAYALAVVSLPVARGAASADDP